MLDKAYKDNIEAGMSEKDALTARQYAEQDIKKLMK